MFNYNVHNDFIERMFYVMSDNELQRISDLINPNYTINNVSYNLMRSEAEFELSDFNGDIISFKQKGDFQRYVTLLQTLIDMRRL